MVCLYIPNIFLNGLAVNQKVTDMDRFFTKEGKMWIDLQEKTLKQVRFLVISGPVRCNDLIICVL